MPVLLWLPMSSVEVILQYEERDGHDWNWPTFVKKRSETADSYLALIRSEILFILPRFRAPIQGFDE